MSDDPGVIDKGWDALPGYTDQPGGGDDAVTVSISTTPGEWLVNTSDAVVVPMSMIEVVEALRSHKLNERSLVWRAGMQEWSPVDKVPQLKLAARLPSVMPPPSSGPVRRTNTTTPPPKPVRTGSSPPEAVGTLPPPRSAAGGPALASAVIRTPLPPPPNLSPRAPVAAALPSRKATLPFGLPTPVATKSKPLQSRPTPRPALPPPGPDDSEVLAVYDRPAATISFDLAPEEPPRTYSAPAALLPQTLAPTTTDSAPRRAPVPPPRNADLSVVAARDFRQAQQFSKRLIIASSVGSALIASLLTLWLSRGETPPPAVATAPAPAATLTQAAPPVVAAPPPVVLPPEPAPTAELASPEPSAKPKAKRKARAWKPPVKAAPAQVTSEEAGEASTPQADPNPYDVQLEDDATKSHGSGLEPESAPRPDATPPTSPGF
ncbi:MAG: domain 2 [Polyangiaceae bacterium]|jgi:hypothetical protein|nr:domain 2 [Polyangiaceae bacterium]